jgi:hypothetical protein
MLCQIASDHPQKPCFWDYHVILIQSSKVVKKGKSVVQAKALDMDSHLPFPCALQEYLDETFNMRFSDKDEENSFAPIFRLIRAEAYIQHFYSDRMHMKNKDGSWIAKPPSYDCITTSNMKKNENGSLSNLDDYIAMKKGKDASKLGEIYTLEQLRSKFGLES